jgi:ribosome modulation factor
LAGLSSLGDQQFSILRGRSVAARLPCPRNYANSAGAGAGVWRDAMADHGELEYATATGNDLAAHERGYRSFITLVKVSVAVIAVILIMMAYFLT